MAEVDFDEVSKLLHIPELVTKNAPQMTHILAEAMARLHKINSGLAEAKQKDMPTGMSGMAVTPAVPSQPVEEPASGVVESAPDQTEPAPEDLQPVEPAPAEPAPPPAPTDDSTPTLRRL